MCFRKRRVQHRVLWPGTMTSRQENGRCRDSLPHVIGRHVPGPTDPRVREAHTAALGQAILTRPWCLGVELCCASPSAFLCVRVGVWWTGSLKTSATWLRLRDRSKLQICAWMCRCHVSWIERCVTDVQDLRGCFIRAKCISKPWTNIDVQALWRILIGCLFVDRGLPVPHMVEQVIEVLKVSGQDRWQSPFPGLLSR